LAIFLLKFAPAKFQSKSHFQSSIIMSTTSQATATVKKKKKKPATDWKKIIIVSVMALVLLSMIAPGAIRMFAGFGSSRRTYSPPPTEETNNATMPSTPATTNNEAVPEPKFQKEGELYFQSAAGGKAISKIDIEKAESEVERQMGLMFRKSMPEDQGMLFLFEASEPQAFWMRNTYIPLDIIFVDENGVINTIHENAKTLNDTSLPSSAPSKYVVEVNGGYAQRHGIKVGDKISWQ
jgi:uncharacterized membrane protein (UPF0127 family)